MKGIERIKPYAALLGAAAVVAIIGLFFLWVFSPLFAFWQQHENDMWASSVRLFFPEALARVWHFFGAFE